MIFKDQLRIIALFCLMVSCEEQYKYSNIDYNSLSQAEAVIDLPDELEEISGLEAMENNKLFAINDEKGIIYTINTDNGKIENRINFKERADFEGLAYDGTYVYAITSKGVLYKINPKHPTNFEKFRWNIEGKEIESLAFYKGKLYTMTKEKNHSTEMTVFAIDPANIAHSMPEPAIRIQLQNIKDFLARDEDKSIFKKLTELISGDNIYNFIRPSAIAFSKKKDNLLILSHHNRFLVEIGMDGKVQNILSLSYKEFHQPEGIAIDHEGSLYISNESRGHLPNILKFNYY